MRRMTNVTITYSPRHSLHFVALALEAVFQTRVKGDKWRFALCVRTCKSSYACENSSFTQKQSHTNVCASNEAKHEHECVNAVLHAKPWFVTHFLHQKKYCARFHYCEQDSMKHIFIFEHELPYPHAWVFMFVKGVCRSASGDTLTVC